MVLLKSSSHGGSYVGGLMGEIQRKWILYKLTVGTSIFAILSVCTHGLENISWQLSLA
jgi:hypothetical protein